MRKEIKIVDELMAHINVCILKKHVHNQNATTNSVLNNTILMHRFKANISRNQGQSKTQDSRKVESLVSALLHIATTNTPIESPLKHICHFLFLQEMPCCYVRQIYTHADTVEQNTWDVLLNSLMNAYYKKQIFY